MLDIHRQTSDEIYFEPFHTTTEARKETCLFSSSFNAASLSALPFFMHEAKRSRILIDPGAAPVKSTSDSFMKPASRASKEPWIFAYAFSIRLIQNSFGSLFLAKTGIGGRKSVLHGK